ncbi:hypothetical protein MMC09_001401 [Bachmanniomyces sp. S44760]|nr:hypothetical protein [Bachmanniomyces sp. S44760]
MASGNFLPQDRDTLHQTTFRESRDKSIEKKKSKEWNPATFYIAIFLIIGSNAIQMIALRNEFTAFTRRTDAKIGVLNDVLERVQRGEDVDVEKMLGTGDPEQEQEWEDVLREIEEEDHLWRTRKQKKPRMPDKTAKAEDEKEKATPDIFAMPVDKPEDVPIMKTPKPVGFY